MYSQPAVADHRHAASRGRRHPARTPLSDRVLTLGEWLRDQGYHTAAIGKMHFNGHRLTDSSSGSTNLIGSVFCEPRLLAKRRSAGLGGRFWIPAAEWLNSDSPFVRTSRRVDGGYVFRQRGDSRDQVQHTSPLCDGRRLQRTAQSLRVSAGMARAVPIPASSRRPRSRSETAGSSLRFLRRSRRRRFCGIQAAYYTSLSFMDSEIGRLIDALDETGLSSQTLVVYVGDNGYMLGQHGRFEKHCFYEPAVRIPVIMRWPEHIPRNVRILEMVEMIDVLPTVLGLMQLPVPPKRHGIDLARWSSASRGQRDATWSSASTPKTKRRWSAPPAIS